MMNDVGKIYAKNGKTAVVPVSGVRIRLTEPMQADGTAIPVHTILTGQARIGERLDVNITSGEYYEDGDLASGI